MTRAAFALMLCCGCGNPRVDTRPVPVDVTEVGPVELGTNPYRPRRRMDIDQLRASIERVTGGVAWAPGGNDQLTRFAPTLGVPDYALNTDEDLSVSPLFLKFLDDAARWVCTELVRRETDGMSERVFLVHAGPEDTGTPMGPTVVDPIDRNLSYLLMRFHARSVEPTSPAVARWRGLWNRAGRNEMAPMAPPDTLAAWRAVCVALIDHPDFYTY